MNKRTAITIAIALIAVVYISPLCQGSVPTVTDTAEPEPTERPPHDLAADELPLFAVWYILACIMFAIVVRIILGER